MLIEVGEPIPIDDYPPEAEFEPDKVKDLAVRIETRLQEMMDRRARERGWPILG